MEWDNDHSVIVNLHNGDLTVYVPKDADAFRHIKARIRLDEAWQRQNIENHGVHCTDVEEIVKASLELYIALAKMINEEHQ